MILVRASVVLLSVYLCGCATIDSGPPSNLDFKGRVTDLVSDLFPQMATMTHKVVVRAGRREMVLTGYIQLDRARGFRAVAVDEFGGKVFAFSRCGEKRSVDFAPPGIDVQLLARGPAMDLELVFLPGSENIVVHTEDRNTIVAVWRQADSEVECFIDRGKWQITGCRDWVGGFRVREISFDYGPETAVAATPTSIRIANRALHYTVEARLLDLRRGHSGNPQWCREGVGLEEPD